MERCNYRNVTSYKKTDHIRSTIYDTNLIMHVRTTYQTLSMHREESLFIHGNAMMVMMMLEPH